MAEKPVEREVVNQDLSIPRPYVPVVEMKYLYPDNPTFPGSTPTAGQTRENAALRSAQLVGLVRVGIGAAVSRYTVIVLVITSPLPFVMVT